MNPFDFVPIADNKPKTCSPYGHNKFQGLSGRIECQITTCKPFFTPLPMDEKDRQRLRKPMGPSSTGVMRHHYTHLLNCANGIPVIPGSSLKGVIRSVAEAVANSCVTFFAKDKNKDYRSYSSSTRFSLPDGFYPCTDLNKLCITCRLLGFQSSKKGFTGKINISDAKARKGYRELAPIILTELSSPKPHHKAFYALPADPNKIAGRKFYFHHKQEASISESPRETHRNCTVKPIENAVFDFQVTFTNLTDDEYALLLYSLFLEDGVCHKIGYGKPAGLGSVKIEPLKITLFDIQKRYHGFAADDREEKSGENLSHHIKEQTNIYRADKSSENIKELRRIWQWPGIHDIKYPDLEK